jgi:hypothetical protein
MSDDASKHTGVERRVIQRRVQRDRRVLIRFLPGKEPRRKNSGRRKEDVGDLSDRD